MPLVAGVNTAGHPCTSPALDHLRLHRVPDQVLRPKPRLLPRRQRLRPGDDTGLAREPPSPWQQAQPASADTVKSPTPRQRPARGRHGWRQTQHGSGQGGHSSKQRDLVHACGQPPVQIQSETSGICICACPCPNKPFNPLHLRVGIRNRHAPGARLSNGKMSLYGTCSR